MKLNRFLIKKKIVMGKSDIFSQFWSTCTWNTLHNLSTLSCIWVLFMSFAMYNHNRRWLCIGTCQPEVIQNNWTFNLVNECMFFGTKALWILDYYAKCDGNSNFKLTIDVNDENNVYMKFMWLGYNLLYIHIRFERL